MRRNFLMYFLFFGLMSVVAHGQAAPTPSPSAQSAVGPEDPVITINGFCANPAVRGNDCKTVVTRAQFEKLADALQPGMALPLLLKVANAYARNMRMSAAAEKRGLDQTPAFEEEMRFARMQLLSQDLDRALRADANNISDAELASYYEKNKSSFEQAAVARIFVPHAKSLPTGTTDDAQKAAAADAMTKVAADLRARAAKGEDLDKLQIEAYAAAGIERTTADTKLEKVRRATLPLQHESVMDLNPGEVSQVFSDPDGAHFIYKMISKETLSLEGAKAEIRNTIYTQRYRDSIKGFGSDVVFSDAYFNPPRESTSPPQRNPKERRRNPPVEHD